MRTPAGTDCKYYYEDFHRRVLQECRLIARNPESLPWSPDLCAQCAVPRILQANQCAHLLLKATVVRRFLVLRRVQVDAYCDAQHTPVAEPLVGCGECHRLKSVNCEL
ncbi:MAG: hypothetical protein ABI874_05510 [Chloroflexota bacterium]